MYEYVPLQILVPRNFAKFNNIQQEELQKWNKVKSLLKNFEQRNYFKHPLVVVSTFNVILLISRYYINDNVFELSVYLMNAITQLTYNVGSYFYSLQQNFVIVLSRME